MDWNSEVAALPRCWISEVRLYIDMDQVKVFLMTQQINMNMNKMHVYWKVLILHFLNLVFSG